MPTTYAAALGVLLGACVCAGRRNSVEFSSLMDSAGLAFNSRKCLAQAHAIEALNRIDGGLRLGRETTDWGRVCMDHAVAEVVFDWLCSKAAVDRSRCVDMVVFDGASAWIDVGGERYWVVGLDGIGVSVWVDAGL